MSAVLSPGFRLSPTGNEIAARKSTSTPFKQRRGARGANQSPVRELSFVADHRPDGERRRHFWKPPIRTDVTEEVHGFQMAEEFRAWKCSHPGMGPMLPSIVADMPRDIGACEIAFLCGMEGYQHSGGAE